MWPLENYRFDAGVFDRLRQHGFDCIDLSEGRVQVTKKSVTAIFVREEGGHYRLLELPGYLIRGRFARLWDAGYQKFWLPVTDTAAGVPDPAQPRIPVVASQLKELHEVTEELRSLLQIPSFYNEALGTTCHVTVYDRLRGRNPAERK